MKAEVPSAKVTRIEVMAVRLPLDEPVSAPGLLIKHRDYLLVRIKCDDGTIGIGFTYIATFGGLSALAVTNDFIANRVIGKEASDPKAVSDDLLRMIRILGRGGPTMNVISAIDIALWDRNARAAGLPLYMLLGADETDSVPAYASGGYLRHREGNDVLQAELQAYLDSGFERIKIKTAYGDLEEDADRVTLARRTVGDDIELMFDTYCRWDDVETAIPHVEKYLEVSPYWIEDPFDPNALDLYEGLAATIDFCLAAGEFYYTSLPFMHLAERGALNVIQAEAPRCGGITGWLEIAKLAHRYPKIELCPCWFHDIHIHLVAAHEKATMVEFFPDDRVFNFRRLIDSPIESKDGRLLMPTRPGLGYDFIDENLERFKLAPPLVLEA